MLSQSMSQNPHPEQEAIAAASKDPASVGFSGHSHENENAPASLTRIPDPARVPSPALATTGRGRRLDWAAIARALGEGAPEERVALDWRVQPRVIRRQVKRSARLRRLIGYFRAEAEATAAARVAALRGKVAEKLDAMLAAGNPRVTLWLADRLKLTDEEARVLLPGASEADLAKRAAKRAHVEAQYRQRANFAAEEKAKARDAKDLAEAGAEKPGFSGAH